MTPTDLSFTAANNSPMLVVDPTNGRFVVAAHRVDAPVFGCGLQVSSNGGRDWVGVDPVPTLPEGAERCYAPEVAFDRKGTLYYLFIGLMGLGNEPMGVFLTTSTNRGRSFSTPWKILDEQNYQVRLAVDHGLGDRGRMYLTWLHSAQDPPLGGLPDTPNPILSAFSDDGGRTFSTPVPVSDPGRRRVVGPSLVLGRDHAVHVAYYDLEDDARDYQGLEGPAWDGTWSLVVTTSLDRGARFGEGVVAADSILPPGRVMLIYTMAPAGFGAGPGDELYLAWPDAREGERGDVFLARSGDGGRSWGRPQRVNDDGGGRVVTQELPRVGVAPGGRIDVAWLDRRNDPDDIRGDVYYTTSSDGGRTWAANVRVTTEPSDSRIGQRYRIPSAAGLVERGSRLAVLSRAGEVLLAWPDTRNGSIGTNQQDVFSAVVEVGGDGGGGGVVWLGVAAGLVLAVVVAGGLTFARKRRRVA
ncbi:MAG: sialidase family protein [Acidimicrobiales bacterium]